jgi:hypothetical protein
LLRTVDEPGPVAPPLSGQDRSPPLDILDGGNADNLLIVKLNRLSRSGRD